MPRPSRSGRIRTFNCAAHRAQFRSWVSLRTRLTESLLRYGKKLVVVIAMRNIVLLLTLVIACSTLKSSAAISGGRGGSGTVSFDAGRDAGDWSAVLNPGTGTDLVDAAGLDM